MSWFDATGFANLAKSALKEAQKTIDKALDIKEEDQKLVEGRTEDSSDFFKSWGLKSNEELENSHGKGEESKQETTSGIWGSFTGSFFESPKINEPENHRKYITRSTSLQSTSIGTQERPWLTSSSSFSEDDKGKGLSPWKDASRTAARKQKYIVHKTRNVPVQSATEKSTSNVSNQADPAGSIVADDAHSGMDDTSEDRAVSNAEKHDAVERSTDKMEDSVANDGESECEGRDCRESESSADDRRLNRMSFASSENDKKSFESVEILGSRSNTDCTTTPDSDGNSLTNSASPSDIGAKVTSESVEILPDSLVTSPSSVEILGDWKSDGSPYLSPIDPRQYETSPVLDRDDSVTPCWEDSDVAPVGSRDTLTDPSSSDVSPYESPLEETKTPRDDSCVSSIDSTPSTGTYPVVGCASGTAMDSESRLSKPLSSTKSEDVETVTARDTDEPDEPTSFTEDSYTSVSESTVMMTLQTFQQKKQVLGRIEIPAGVPANDKMHDSCPDVKETPLKDSMAEIRLNLSLDSLKEKDSLHLPIEAITTQPIRKTECLDGAGKIIEADLRSYDRLINTTIEPAEPDRYSVDEILHSLKLDTLDQTADQHLISTDSSCEGTLIESSSEENPSLIRKPEGNVSQAPLTSSSYVKTMLADAMIEKGEAIELDGQSTEMPRDNSPISSESRSDLVKIGSDQTSGHTSGDELETTTSSDIEIISSPNGDSSSTQSRQSLAKLPATKGSDLLAKALKTRGHSRELSEISVGSDEANLEIEKLLKRIQEMTEILEARESKLIDVSRMNMELHEQNNSLKKQLDSFEKHAEQSQNLNQITDEYMQRLSALESKFQQTIRERDSLRKNLEQLKVEAATRMSSQEIFTLSAEKDEIIKELREEGEKLSKQQLQHSNIIKKLRAKEKENDALVKSQKEQIEEQTSELERLKRSLHAKEEVERTQIEAVHTLTAKTKKQEKEILTLQERLDNALHKMDAYKNSLDAAKMDLSETKKLLAATELELKDATTNAGESCQLLAQVEELKIKLRESEETHVKKEVFFKHENSELLKRLEAAEARSEELSESVSTATKPLLRQLEQLQANLIHKSHSFVKQEKALSERNLELQAKVDSLIETDRYFKEENVNFKSKISQLESKLAVKEIERNQLQELYDQLMAQKEKLVEQTAWYRQKTETLQQSHASQITEMNREIVALENKLAVEKAATDAERRKNHTMSKQRQSINDSDGDGGGGGDGGDDDDGDDNERFSPTTAAKHHSTNRINIWPLGNSPAENSSERYTTVYDSIRTGSNSTSVFENLQAQLKQKDGEIQQLQWELSRRNTERDALNTELSTLTLKIEELNNKVSNVTVLNENLHEVQTRYDALLQMYGEKMEENQELRLDLQDIKEMYKIQIDQLLKRDA
ncbi:TATA element modulatory factor isoform X2 [Andrena cerasifolii]|uniref:TATA element modulatory factor isoform X2 n=1 Tax=Andrena cerasifolii TaxID=2819439 RepID=UPI0040381D71